LNKEKEEQEGKRKRRNPSKFDQIYEERRRGVEQ